MKYLYLVLLSIIMTFTWSVVQSDHGDQSVPELVHAEIQDDLKNLISEYIQKQLPNVKNIKFNKIWSESVSNNIIKAHFNYSFDDENANVGQSENLIDGYAILNKSAEQQVGATIWTVDEIQILNNHVTFKKGITLSFDDDEDEQDKEDNINNNDN